MRSEETVVADVLVVGGGMAGAFAAIKAREHGRDVVWADKGYISKSGLTPWAMDYCVFNPGWGHDHDAWVDELVVSGEYINNRDWIEAVIGDSYERFQDLVSYGVRYLKKDDGEPLVNSMGGTVTETVLFEETEFTGVLRRHAKKTGVRLMDRTMITDLLTREGVVVGAMGMKVDDATPVRFAARAVVMCTGTYGFKPYSFPGYELTADGDMMAYRAGAEIVGKEFTPTNYMGTNPAQWYYFMHSMSEFGWMHTGEGFPVLRDGNGDEVVLHTPVGFRELDFAAHDGRTPLVMKCDNETASIFRKNGLSKSDSLDFTGGVFKGMEVHGSEGIWVPRTDGASTLQGLFAAGDSAGTIYMGSTYCNWGFALGGAGMTGARAGMGAADYAASAACSEPDVDVLDAARQRLLAPLGRTAGFSPKWVTTILNSALIPYFVLSIKHADRLEAALTTVTFLRDHCVPRLTAKDAHEARLALETENMVLNAEMKLRASLFRTESRGRHFREDFPLRNDEEWIAWVVLGRTGSEMAIRKEMLPKEWWPDQSLSYAERYPFTFPQDKALQPQA